jgi:hypothetical protein
MRNENDITVTIFKGAINENGVTGTILIWSVIGAISPLLSQPLWCHSSKKQIYSTTSKCLGKCSWTMNTYGFATLNFIWFGFASKRFKFCTRKMLQFQTILTVIATLKSFSQHFRSKRLLGLNILIYICKMSLKVLALTVLKKLKYSK